MRVMTWSSNISNFMKYSIFYDNYWNDSFLDNCGEYDNYMGYGIFNMLIIVVY